jgi:2-dehydropantoate 2-reductase
MGTTGKSIAIVGVGAIGGSVAADLADLGRHDVTLCTRTPFDRLVVEHPSGTSSPETRILSRPEDAQQADWVLLATKAYQSEEARPWLDALCGPNG